jgi:hypothetical protein
MRMYVSLWYICRSLNHSFIHPFIHSSIHPRIHASIHPCIHASMHFLHACTYWKCLQESPPENDSNATTALTMTRDGPNPLANPDPPGLCTGPSTGVHVAMNSPDHRVVTDDGPEGSPLPGTDCDPVVAQTNGGAYRNATNSNTSRERRVSTEELVQKQIDALRQSISQAN